MRESGVIPRQALRRLLSPGHIHGVAERYLNQASIDIPLSAEAYRLVNAFLPPKGKKVRTYLKRAEAQPHDLSKMLEVGVSYLIRAEGAWRLPKGVRAYANPKSSSGRIFLSSRVLADGAGMYDALESGWKGELWLMVCPRKFPVFVYPGIALAQLRFFTGNAAFLSPQELSMAVAGSGLLFDEKEKKIIKPRAHADSLLLSLHVGENMGWECRGTNRPLDLARRDHDWRDFFAPIEERDGAFDLRVGTTYILTTRERVMVPPTLSAELRKIDPRFGDFDVHDAGYVDPGWGWGRNGAGKGRPITLEVTPHENMSVFHGQYVARIRYEHMTDVPELHYDTTSTSNYRGQEGPRLAKFFKI